MQMKNLSLSSFLAIAILAFASPAMAGFIVDVTGAGSVNASGNTPGTSVPSTAFGITGSNSWFGGTPSPDVYTFSYTPGTDADNLVIPNGQVLGDVRVDAPSTFVAEGQAGTGIVGGGSGLYNVYITWPETQTTDSDGSTITITNDGADIVLNPITMNSDENGAGAKGNNAWLKIASNIPLTGGVPYSVTVAANDSSFVSQRVHGVLWEAQTQIPEPTSLALVGLGMTVLLASRRRSV